MSVNENLEYYETILEKLKIIQSKMLLALPDRQRWISNTLEQNRAFLLIGPRGVGKTTYLLSLIHDKTESLYLSLDNTLLSDINLFEFGDWLFTIGYRQLIFDEVHVISNWSQHIKSLYDSNPKKRIIASDSSTLVLRKGVGDLSRRFVNRSFPFLSFREYLWLKHGVDMIGFNWQQFISPKYVKILEDILDSFDKKNLSILKEFRAYLKEGYRPFFLEGNYSEKSIQIIDKIIYQNVPYFLPEVNERHIHLMRNIIGYLAESKIPRLIIDSLATKWQVSKTTVYNLLEVMKETSLIRIIQKEGSRAFRSRGEKIFFSDPTHYSCLMGDLGNLRESFFCAEIARLNLKCYSSEDEIKGDFKVDNLLFEVGGAGKKSKGSDLVMQDNIEFSDNPKIRPLWTLGFCD